MNKKQLLDELKKKFYKIGTIENAETSEVGKKKREIEGVNWYLVSVYEEKNGVMVRRNIPIYVENEGKPNEKAFYGEAPIQTNIIPEPPKESPFKNIKGEIERETKDYAVVKRFVIEAGVAIEKRFLVEKEGDKFKETPIRETSPGIK